ncbi:replication-relaxation family protein [Granulosicoccus sp. 3-233]|uniref:replication-relaxation family protein n=1 Tax=Granulosicoccus sp. 3-233 TaxID=3417969 RepID=UPI003D33E0DF
MYSIYTHRFMTAEQIQKVVDPSWHLTNLKNRLTALFRNDYVARPQAQFGEFVEGGGSRPLVYALGREGKKVLLEPPYSLPLKSVNVVSNNTKVERPHIKHTLITTEVVANARVACSERGITFIDETDLIQTISHPERNIGKHRTRSWPVPAFPPLTAEPSWIIPDRMFCLHFPDRPDGQNRLYFFLEADRGTENHVSADATKATLARKMRQYRATAKSRALREHFPAIGSFIVLVVGMTPKRIHNMLVNSQAIEGGWNKLLFSDLATVESTPFFEIPWQEGKNRSVVTLGSVFQR